MDIDDTKDIFILSDGSLFFLSAKYEDTALYNCAVIDIHDVTIVSDPAALIVTGDIDQDDFSPVIDEKEDNEDN